MWGREEWSLVNNSIFIFGFTLIVETKQNSRLLSVIGGFVTQFQLSSLNFSKMNLPRAKTFLNGCCFTDLAARLYYVALWRNELELCSTLLLLDRAAA